MPEYPVHIPPVEESDNCWTTPRRFLEQLRNKLRVKIPDSDFPKVWVSTQQPSGEQADYLWVRVTAAGKPVGLFKQWKGQWVPIQYFAPGSIMVFTGPAASIPDGWELCDGNNGTVDLSGKFDGTASDYTLCYIQYMGYSD